MCGICAILDPRNSLGPIVKMNQIQQHRGPDDEDYVVVNSATTQWTAAGGRDTPTALNLLPHQSVALQDFDLTSDTDTEVILAAHAESGIDCLSRFNGMFAFALWAARQRRLFCARDRFGIKPFYYY